MLSTTDNFAAAGTDGAGLINTKYNDNLMKLPLKFNINQQFSICSIKKTHLEKWQLKYFDRKKLHEAKMDQHFACFMLSKHCALLRRLE